MVEFSFCFNNGKYLYLNQYQISKHVKEKKIMKNGSGVEAN